MFRPTHRQPLPRRRGVILMVVLILLTLFALVGLAFVFYAQSQAEAARIAREAEDRNDALQPDVSPEVLLAEFLRQAIYDLPEMDGSGYTAPYLSALRGHSIVRAIYGYNPTSP